MIQTRCSLPHVLVVLLYWHHCFAVTLCVLSHASTPPLRQHRTNNPRCTFAQLNKQHQDGVRTIHQSRGTLRRLVISLHYERERMLTIRCVLLCQKERVLRAEKRLVEEEIVKLQLAMPASKIKVGSNNRAQRDSALLTSCHLLLPLCRHRRSVSWSRLRLGLRWSWQWFCSLGAKP